MAIPEKHLILLKRSLTKEEYKRILPNFQDNYNKKYSPSSLKRAKSGSVLLNDAFDWSSTSQGHMYWSNIYSTIRQRESSLETKSEIYHEST